MLKINKFVFEKLKSRSTNWLKPNSNRKALFGSFFKPS
jgi:hypothetical protein